ncbi:EFR3 like cmp44E, partial [Brachionus plicatilis]
MIFFDLIFTDPIFSIKQKNSIKKNITFIDLYINLQPAKINLILPTKRTIPMLFVRGDGVILVSPLTRNPALILTFLLIDSWWSRTATKNNVIMLRLLLLLSEIQAQMIQKLLEQGYGLAAQMQPVSHSAMSNTSSYGTLNNTSNESLRYQKKAAGLFQTFCEKESSNLSNYNLNFDQFVCQFSSLCFNSHKEESMRAEIRSSGLQCLATMVHRLVPDDNLRAGYIWDNMDKIVAGILFIIHERYTARHKTSCQLDHSDYDYHEDEQELAEYIYGELYTSTRLRQSVERVDAAPADQHQVVIGLDEEKREDVALEPEHEAKTLLRNICTKADYTTISKIVVPILDFLDDNGQLGWHLAKFVRCIFLIVIYNVRQQHAFVVRELLKHLDSHRNSQALLKCHIIRTIILCTKISAMQSVGTTSQIIDIFNNLLKHLNISVEKAYNLSSKKADNLTDENKLQKEIISAMRQFTQNMPDYAKNDILVFFARQINTQQFSYFELSGNGQADKNELELLNGRKRAKYYECLYEICTRYRPVQVFGAFGSQQFLDDSLKLILVNDYASRNKANQILQLLIDKHHMLDRIQALKPATYRLVPVLKKNFQSTTSLTESSLSLNHHNHQHHEQSTAKLSRNQTFLSQLSLDKDKTKNGSAREDSMFMRKHGRTILSHFTEYLFIANNRRENYESAYVTLSLI